MKIYEQDNEEIGDFIFASVEKETGKKIYTMRTIGDHDTYIEVVIAFKDKDMMMARIEVEKIAGRLACRIRGNYL